MLDELKVVYENLTHAQERGTALHNQIVELKKELETFRRPILEIVFGKKTAELIFEGAMICLACEARDDVQPQDVVIAIIGLIAHGMTYEEFRKRLCAPHLELHLVAMKLYKKDLG